MPIIYEPPKPHECDTPIASTIELLDLRLGALYLCEECGRVHELRMMDGHEFWYQLSLRRSKKLAEKYKESDTIKDLGYPPLDKS